MMMQLPFLRLSGRDLTHPLDGEGSPTVNGLDWIINPAHIVAVTQGTTRGPHDAAAIYLRDRREPIQVCESVAFVAAALGIGMIEDIEDIPDPYPGR